MSLLKIEFISKKLSQETSVPNDFNGKFLWNIS